MPFTSRVVEPVFVCLGSNLKGVKNDLEALSVHSSGELIKQMNSINEHALNLFGELSSEIDSIVRRTNDVSIRMQRIIDHSKEPIRNEDNSAAPNWRLSIDFKQPFSKENPLPETVKKLYDNCEEIPALAVFDKYRKDGKSSLKLYTNPDYALEQWILMMQQDLEVKKQKKQKVKIITKPKTNEVVVPLTNTKLQNQINQVPEWERTMSSSLRKSNNNLSTSHQPETIQTSPAKTSETRKSSIDQQILKNEAKLSVTNVKPAVPTSLKAYKSNNGKESSGSKESSNEYGIINDESSLRSSLDNRQLSNAQADLAQETIEVVLPDISLENDIPLPPPMNDFLPPPPPPCPFIPSGASKTIPITSTNSRPIEIIPNPKDDLLSSIRSGMNLKKVEISEKKEKNQPQGFGGDTTVAAMLARRQAMQDSDSEDDNVEDDDWE